jgi:hypothetical protein
MYRTLLLGMKPSRDYHFRVTASTGSSSCSSEDYTLRTGALPNGLRKITVTTNNAAGLAGGFLISGEYQAGPVFILDADGDYVWWHESNGQVARARMSYDGKYMWFMTNNVAGGGGRMARVTMDGVDEQVMREFGDNHHDFTVLPDETIAFIEHDGAQDRIMERAPDGTTRQVVSVPEAHGGTTQNHTNSIHYHPSDDTYTFSDLAQNCYVKVTRQGEVKWILGGSTNQFTGDTSWDRQHGHELLENGNLLFFNNGQEGANANVIELDLDEDAKTAQEVWRYPSSYGSNVMGDVARLPNGNTLVTYSASGIVEELDPQGSVLQELSWPLGGATGYTNKRPTLYGPPPDTRP